ncbi:hypothetical protein [Buttiauxella noackiae]|uniref:hypothetical protein n=1 Tax=Buttiauxella noackiae TaxID=82992 RepID=UPI0028D8C067|nr:hypothetical protein [Buttiauxella noackiae]
MNIDIPGKPEDYFTEREDEIGEKTYKANRERLRALVAIRNLKIQEVLASKENSHQANLDLNDQFDEFLSSLPALARVAIYDTYVEELNAATATIIDETNRINAECVVTEERNHLMGQAIAVVVIIFIAAVIIFTL